MVGNDVVKGGAWAPHILRWHKLSCLLVDKIKRLFLSPTYSNLLRLSYRF